MEEKEKNNTVVLVKPQVNVPIVYGKDIFPATTAILVK